MTLPRSLSTSSERGEGLCVAPCIVCGCVASQRDNEEWKVCGRRRYIQLQFMEDYTSLGHVDLAIVRSAVTREAALGVDICETYAVGLCSLKILNVIGLSI